MMCERSAQVHAYHDGELSPVQVAALEAHLRDCAACAELLAELRQVSQLVAAAPMVDMPPAAMKRMQQAWWAAQDRGVLRVASWLTAAAAAVILAAVIYSSPGDRGEPMTTANAPQLVALMQQSSPTFQQDADEPQDELLIATQYIANDLSAVVEGQVAP